MITIITIGKKHEPWIIDGLERYSKRLRAPWDVKWVLLPHSSLGGDSAREDESERILKALKPQDYVVLMDERGKMYDAPTLSQLFTDCFTSSRSPVIIVGGAFGVTDDLRARADAVWSLSKLVFPHQLVRLMLIEQLYRSQEIAKGSGYHHK